MNKELWLVIIPAVSWLLFSLGGTQISSTIPGKKWIRRYILPAFYLLCCLAATTVFKSVVVALLAVGAFSLGYGQSKPYWYKFLVGCGYGMISLPIGYSWWNLIIPVGFISIFALSNWKPTAKVFVWKICEGSFGLLVGISLAYVLI